MDSVGGIINILIQNVEISRMISKTAVPNSNYFARIYIALETILISKEPRRCKQSKIRNEYLGIIISIK